MLYTKTLHCLDAKNRMRLPSKLRDELAGPYYVVKGDGNWLDVLSEAQVQTKIEELKKLPKHDVKIRYIIANFVSSGFLVEEDSQGRFVLPADLREYAGIVKDIVIIKGLYNIEIYSQENWDKQVAGADMGLLADSLKDIEQND